MEEYERSTDAFEEGAGGDPAQDVDAQEESRNEEDFDDGQVRAVDEPQSEADEETGEAEEGTDPPEPATRPQTREENAAIRAARLQAARAERQEAEKETDAAVAAAGIPNPYTGKPFASMKELQEYGQQLREANLAQEAERTGKSVDVLREEDENRRFLSSLRKQAEQGANAGGSPQADFIREDLQNFLAAHPEMDADALAALEQNKQFRAFCGSRFGREPLAELYDAYQSLVRDTGKAAVAKATGRAARSTGAGSSGGPTLSPSQQNQLDAWNRANPDMQMTAKEFLGL